MILDDVASYLAAQSTRLTVGVNLTKGYMPPAPATVVTIFETGGLAPLHTMSTAGTVRALEQPGLMIHARSTDYQTARILIGDAYRILDNVGNRNLPTTSGTWYGSIDASQAPFDIGQDANERHMLSVNFIVRKAT